MVWVNKIDIKNCIDVLRHKDPIFLCVKKDPY